MTKMVKNNPDLMRAIVRHTKINMEIRKKLKVMLHKLPVPDLVERTILDFIGMKKFIF
jgi:hypothetical protein